VGDGVREPSESGAAVLRAGCIIAAAAAAILPT